MNCWYSLFIISAKFIELETMQKILIEIEIYDVLDFALCELKQQW